MHAWKAKDMIEARRLLKRAETLIDEGTADQETFHINSARAELYVSVADIYAQLARADYSD